MTVKPRHLAAAQYSIVATFSVASWYVLLSPFDRALGQLQFIFADDYEHRTLFIFFALVTVAATLLAVIFWFERSASLPLAATLAGGTLVLFALSIWLFDTKFIFGFGLGFGFALWSWYAPNMPALTKERIKK